MLTFWIDQLFQIKHQYLPKRHFGIKHHTAKTIQNILCEYGIDVFKINATTDHGANVVAAFQIGILNSSA